MAKTKSGNGSAAPVPVGEHEQKALALVAAHDARMQDLPRLVGEVGDRISHLISSWRKLGRAIPEESREVLARYRVEQQGLEAELRAGPAVRADLQGDVLAGRAKDQARAAAEHPYKALLQQISPLLWAITSAVEGAEQDFALLRQVVHEANELDRAHGLGRVVEPKIEFSRGFWSRPFGEALKRHLTDRTRPTMPADTPAASLGLGAE